MIKVRPGLIGYRSGLTEGEVHDYYIDYRAWDDDWPSSSSKNFEEEDDWWDPVHEWD